MTGAFAELHLHLEGAIEPETLAEIDPTITPAQARAKFVYRNFADFIEVYKWVLLQLRQPEHYAIAARALRRKLTAEGITYAEINLSVGGMLWKNQDARSIISAIQAELDGWPLILDAIRQHDLSPAIRVAELAVEFGAGFGIGGDESAKPLSDFTSAISLSDGNFYPHAGETSDARSIWDALEHGARRIGHGIRAIDDPALCRELRDRSIPLEVCISSNVATGAVPSLDAHPVRRLFDLGVPIVLNTDDPAMFHTSLAREYQIARDHFGFNDVELEQLRQNAFQYAMAR